MNILITGSRGFIGSNLKNFLSNKYNILEYNRGDSIKKLENLNNIDIIFHLAGEVNPKLNDYQIFEGNVKLTSVLSNNLKKITESKLIIYTSSIHAQYQNNSYGRSKREAEKILENIAFETNHKVIIYRLPHLFGEGCRPNHNSVITTWIYNCIKEKEIIIYDENMKIRYTYIKDLINDFIFDIKKNIDNEFLIYKKPTIMYDTTLGNVAKLICSYKKILEQKRNFEKFSDFENKLFKTFKYYFNTLKG